jgi:heavy metal translocating P-type ATPase
VAVGAVGLHAGQGHRGPHRARALSEARRLRDDFSQAWLLDEAGGRSRVPVAELCRTRSRVSVLPGEAVSVDGVVLSGEGLVQETPLTGEPLPVVRRPGDRLLAGSHSVDGAFVLRPERLAGERRLDAVLAAVEQGGVERPSTLQRQADRLMQWFVPAVVLTAAATFLVWLAVLPTGLWWQALFNAMAVLLVACPCALGLATPTAIWGGLVRFSTFGLVAQGGRLLDTLAEANLILFDKTGTLSHDSLALVDFITTEDSPEERRRLLAALAAMEDGLPHPIARAFAQAAGGNGALQPVERRTLVPGQGLRAWVDGREIAVGEASLTGLPETAFAPLLARSRAVEGGCKKRVHVAVDGRPAALAVLDEHLRDNAAATFRELTALGLRLLVLTGDPDPRWREIEGVEVRPGLSPDDKARIVRELRARGEALTFVGDGINDAPAMTAAGSAIAMGSGAALALSSADGILSDGNLAALPRAIRIARRVRAGIRGNMLFAVCYNAIGMALAAAGILHPAVAALLMVGSSTFVSARALATAREEQGAN